MRIVGVDPGSRYVGIVRIDGDAVAAACVLTRTTGDELPDQAFVNEVVTEIAVQNEHADGIGLEWLTIPHHRNPEGRETIMNVAGLIGTGIIIGAVLARFPTAIVVDAGGNGSLPDYAYPEPLRKRVRLGGPSTHARSAYDVAKQAGVLLRAQRAGGKQ